MEALGMIETRGLLAAIESADVMLKSADVKLLEKVLVGGGLVTVTITGDVAAVKSSIDAAVAAVSRLGTELLVSQHVIPRPHLELCENVISSVPMAELVCKEEAETEIVEDKEFEQKTESTVIEIVQEESMEEPEKAETELAKPEAAPADEIHKEDVDAMVAENGVEKAVKTLEKYKLIKLRSLAREYKDFGIMGREISKANKNELLDEFTKYYN